MSENFNVEAFIEGLKKDKSKEFTGGNNLVKVSMNRKNYQGTITFVPFIAKNIGNIYTKLEGVREWYGETALLDSNEAWFRILPLKFYKGITPEQIELYNEVVSLFDACNESGKYGYDALGQEAILKVRNFSLFTGILLKHSNTEGEKVEENVDKPCLFIFPSNAPIDAMDNYVSGLADTYERSKLEQLINMIITPANKGRKGVLQITFKKSSSPGYNSSVAFIRNDDLNQVIDPNKEFSQDIVSLFDDPVRAFLGWMYDWDNQTYFNETFFIELRDNLKAALLEVLPQQDESDTENKNGNIDPMAQPPIPSVDQPKQEVKPQPAVHKAPF